MRSVLTSVRELVTGIVVLSGLERLYSAHAVHDMDVPKLGGLQYAAQPRWEGTRRTPHSVETMGDLEGSPFCVPEMRKGILSEIG